MHRLLAVICVVASWPFLPGAGCRAHHAALVTADVSGAAAPVVVYFVRGGACGPTGADCLDRPELWRPLRDCSIEPVAAARPEAVRVSGCTSYIGVDYAIDIMAFDDRDGDGQLDPGERYGLWSDGPLRRERERQVGAIAIEIGHAR